MEKFKIILFLNYNLMKMLNNIDCGMELFMIKNNIINIYNNFVKKQNMKINKIIYINKNYYKIIIKIYILLQLILTILIFYKILHNNN